MTLCCLLTLGGLQEQRLIFSTVSLLTVDLFLSLPYTHSLTHYALLVYHNNNYLNLYLTLPVPLLNVLFVLFRLTVSIMWNSLTHRNLLICCISVICRHMVILTCLKPPPPLLGIMFCIIFCSSLGFSVEQYSHKVKFD